MSGKIQNAVQFSSAVSHPDSKNDAFIVDTRVRYNWDIKKSILNIIFYGIALTFLISMLKTYSDGNEIVNQTNFSTAKSVDFPPSTCAIPELKSKDQFFKYLDEVGYPCQNLITIGGSPYPGYPDHIDGDKKVCLDPLYQFTKGNCTVLSFGISSDWSFEDEIDKNFGCKVHAFDPSIGLKSHSRSDNVKFYNIALGYRDMITTTTRFRKFGTLINRLHLLNKDIDFLKMDVEGSEFYFFEEVFQNNNFLLNKIKQIIIEIHPAKNPPKKYLKLFWDALRQFECYGFRVVGSYPNLLPPNLYTVDGHVRSIGYEILWVNAIHNQK